MMMSNPNALMVICVIRPMNDRSRPIAVIRGQILKAGVTERVASSAFCFEVRLVSVLAFWICSIVASSVRASKGFVKQVTRVCGVF